MTSYKGPFKRRNSTQLNSTSSWVGELICVTINGPWVIVICAIKLGQQVTWPINQQTVTHWPRSLLALTNQARVILVAIYDLAVSGDNPPIWRQLPGDNRPLPKIPPEVTPDPRVLDSLRVRNMCQCQFSDNSRHVGRLRRLVLGSGPSVRAGSFLRGWYFR